jgi:hypothetical protein
MGRFLVVVCAAATALALMAGPAAADRTNARHYEAIPVTCDELGEVVIEVVNVGNWGTGKVQGTQLTLIPRFFDFAVFDADDEVVFADRVAKRNPMVDDVCHGTFVEEVPEDDPFLDPGVYRFEFSVGVRVVGRT